MASKKGLLAAAGPDSVVVASTESVREAFKGNAPAGGTIKPFQPQLTLQIGTRISQVAFSSDESVLVISAEAGGGLAIYDVQALLQGNTQSTFELATGGASVRALVPNPATNSAEFFAVVTTNGELMITNVKTRQFIAGPNGQVMKSRVSCVSWSNKGKQLVAGLGDGTAFQMTPEGVGKAELPKPDGLDGDQHGKMSYWMSPEYRLIQAVSSIAWLENDLFLLAHTPTNFDEGMAPTTTYHFVTRQKTGLTFQKLPEVCGPWGLNRSPPVQFIQRLRDFEPNLRDLIIVSSTASQDIGLFTRSKVPLTSSSPQEKITDVFTTTTMANDSRRAQLPMTEDMSSDTSPIGVALDLSSTSNVPRPLPGEEMDESQGPLPAVMILNHEGVLTAWWIVYAESIRQGTHYSGLAVYAGQHQSQPQAQNQIQAQPVATTTPSAFGQSAFGQGSTGGASSAPAFGTPSKPGGMLGSGSAFGSGGATSGSAFGAPSGLGNRTSPWGSSTPSQPANPTSGPPAFGSSTPLGGGGQPAFGSTGSLGQKLSPWGASPANTAAATGSTFGQPSEMGKPSGMFGSSTPTANFGSNTTSSGGTSGFAGFAAAGGFAVAAAAKGGKEDVLKQQTPTSSFNSTMDVGSSFGGTPQKTPSSGTGLFGTGSGGFVLGSAWKNENAAKPDANNPSQPPSDSLFGSGFGKALDDASQDATAPQSKEAEMTSDMSDADEVKSPQKQAEPETTTPADTPAPQKFFQPSTAPGGIFGSQGMNEAGNASQSAATTPKAPPPMIKKESSDGSHTPFAVNRKTSEPPLPPDSTSKTSYTPGNSSASSTAASKGSVEETPLHPDFAKPALEPQPRQSGEGAVPLPPDFVKPNPKVKSVESVAKAAPLPPDFLRPEQSAADPKGVPEDRHVLPEQSDEGLDDEGSGVDVAQELSPTTDQSPKMTPESSFGGKVDRSPIGERFTKVGKPQQGPKPLFGEIGRTSVPILPPPSKNQQSPRSPSPIRSSIPGDLLRPESARSVSAPGVPSRNSVNRKVTLGRPNQQTIQPPQFPSVEQRQKEERERVARERERQREQEEQELSDREDEQVREELASQVEGSLTLEPFITHQDYVGHIEKEGIPAEIERVYRDINSMIDTLGLNSRSLQSFLKGHMEMDKDGGRDKDDLENPGEWCLVEIENLDSLEDKLGEALKESRPQDFEGMVDSCKELQREIAKTRAKQNDIKRIVEAQTDPESLEALRTASLSAEQSVLRYDLRKDFAAFQKSLAAAEEAISMLRAKLATAHAGRKSGSSGSGSSSGSDGKPAQKVPTVEAVERTILKMTGMVEKRSGNIDLLETQMRRLNVLGAAVAVSTPRSSRENSPFVTPPTSARRPGRGGKGAGDRGGAAPHTPGSSVNGSGGGFYTPRSIRGGGFSGGSVASRASEWSSSGRRIAGGGPISRDDAVRYAGKVARRKEINVLVKEALVGAQPRVRALHEG